VKSRGRALAGRLQYSAVMTLFDRVWEPLAVLVGFAVILLATL
jgi:hypothetical protein